MKKGNKDMNEFIGMDIEGLQKQKKTVEMCIQMYEKEIIRIKEKAKQEIKENKNYISDLEKRLMQIVEAEEYYRNNKVEYQNIIVVSHKNIYRTKPGTRSMYPGDISNLLTYKGYSFTVYATNNINNPKDTKVLYCSNDFLMDEKVILRDKMLEKIEEFNVKKIYLEREVSIGTKVYENMGVIVEKRDYI